MKHLTASIASHRFILPVLIVFATLITFSPVIRNGFVSYDDSGWIANNSHLREPSVSSLMHFWTSPVEGLYVPVTFSYWLMLASIKLSPGFFHGMSVLVHACSAVVVYLILRRLRMSDVGACIGALLFALHPLQTESVAWASGAKDLLAGFFSLLLIHEYLVAIEEESSQKRILHLAVAMLALILGVLSKPSAVVAPAIAGVLDALIIRKNPKAMIQSLWPMLPVMVACVIWSRKVQTDWFALDPSMDVGLWMRPLVATDAVAFYAHKLLLPVKLSVFYGRTPTFVRDSGMIYWSWIIPASLIIMGLSLKRRDATLLASVLVFIVGVSPVLGLTPFSFQIHSTVADHYVYLAMLGAALLVGHYIRGIGVGIVAVMLAVLGMTSFLQARHWRDSVSLMQQAVNVTPWNPDARGHLAFALMEAGRSEEAIAHFEQLVQLQPTNVSAHEFLGRALLEARRYEQAERELTIALRLRPDRTDLRQLLESIQQRQLDSPTTRQ